MTSFTEKKECPLSSASFTGNNPVALQPYRVLDDRAAAARSAKLVPTFADRGVSPVLVLI